MGGKGKGKGKGKAEDKKDGKQWSEVIKYDHFEGDVKVCSASDIPSDVKSALEKATVLGVDFEWKGAKGPIALVGAVTDGGSVLLVRVNAAEGEARKLPDFLEKAFKSGDVTKAIGGFWGPKRNDATKLEETFGLKFDDLAGFVGLSNMGKDKGLYKTGLEALAALFDWSLKKDFEQKTSDWEAEELSDKQKQYAADDVWFTLQVYLKLKDYTKPPPPLKTPKFKKVKGINPDSKGVNLLLKCVSDPVPVDGQDSLKEVVCGDETGRVTVSLRGDAASVCKAGASLQVQNAHAKMIKGHVRLAVDKWGVIKVAPEPHTFEVDDKNDISATEYELVKE